MYAVIKNRREAGRVAEGQRVDVELLGQPVAASHAHPVLLVDGDTVLSTPDELSGASVTARVVAETKGPKVTGFKYKNKSTVAGALGPTPEVRHDRESPASRPGSRGPALSKTKVQARPKNGRDSNAQRLGVRCSTAPS